MRERLASLHILHCSDDFVRARGTWPHNDEWTNPNGVVLDTGDAAVPNYGYAKPASPITANLYVGARSGHSYSVELVADNAGVSGGKAVGVLARTSYTSGRPTYYRLYFNGAGTLAINKVVSGNATVLVSKAMAAISPAALHTYRLTVDGTSLKAYVDGNLQLTTIDSAIVSGSPGIRVTSSAPRLYEFACYADGPSLYNVDWTDFFLTGIDTTTSATSNHLKIPLSMGRPQLSPSRTRRHRITGYLTSTQTNIREATDFLEKVAKNGSYVYFRGDDMGVGGVITDLSFPSYRYGGKKKVASFSFEIREAARPR